MDELKKPRAAGDPLAIEALLKGVLDRLQNSDADVHLSTVSAQLRTALEHVNARIDLVQSQGNQTPHDPSTSQLLQRLSAHAPTHPRYRIEGELARGGMGAILKIWDEDLRRPLAMKVALTKSASTEASGETDPKVLARFLEEAQITGQLDHPGVVPVHELSVDSDGRVFFTMRLVKGQDLRAIFELVREGRDGWTQARALGVLHKVCEAMAYAHSKGVIHRDLKPANVMVGKFGEVYVMDWGLARVAGRDDCHDLRVKPQLVSTQSVVETERRAQLATMPDSPVVTMDGDVVGTPAYMPPEQAKGQLDQLQAHSDVYALGAMLYQLLAGEMPYVPRDARVSPYTVLMRVIEGPPRSLRELAPAAPQELVSICEKAMSRDVGRRYRDMTELAEDLRAHLEGGVVRAYQSTIARRVRTYWRGQARPTRLGLTIGYVVFPLLALVSFVIEQWNGPLTPPALSLIYLLVFGTLALVSSGLLLAGVFTPRSKRLLGVIGLLPALLLTSDFLGMGWRRSFVSEPGWRTSMRADLAAGRYDSVVAALSAVPLNERDASDQAALVQGLACSGRMDEALAALDEQREFSVSQRRFGDLYACAALLYLERDEFDEARAALREHLDTWCP